MGNQQKLASIEVLRDRLRTFAKERDWDQFHTPKNLSMALIAEAAELVEHFQWVDGDKSHLLEEKLRPSVEEELADIFIYLVRIADKLGIDLYDAAERKIAINARKYPADRVRGSAKKYTEYED
ncbi:MAG: nucleotide pyrophosphohydrolase [Geobacter sp.]|nr:nucleotide pyrophosphohydrolase [Geobacter sp.]